MNSLYGLPDYVKQAAPADTCRPPHDLPAQAFADPFSRRYPCHTKAATVLSHLFFKEFGSNLPASRWQVVNNNLTKRAQYWDIESDLQAIAERRADSARISRASVYQVKLARADYTGEDTYVLDTQEHLKKAARWLRDNWSAIQQRYPYEERVKFASHLLERATNLDYRYDPDTRHYLQCVAGRAVGDSVKAARMIRDRVKLAELKRRQVDPQEKQRALKLADHLEARPENGLNATLLQKVALFLDSFDRYYGDVGQYDDAFYQEPEAIFSLTSTKLAHLDKTYCKLSTGAVYEAESLLQLDPETIHKNLGQRTYDSLVTCGMVDLTKVASAVQALPRLQAEILEGMLSEKGVKEAARHTPADVGFTEQELVAMAAR